MRKYPSIQVALVSRLAESRGMEEKPTKDICASLGLRKRFATQTKAEFPKEVVIYQPQKKGQNGPAR